MHRLWKHSRLQRTLVWDRISEAWHSRTSLRVWGARRTWRTQHQRKEAGSNDHDWVESVEGWLLSDNSLPDRSRLRSQVFLEANDEAIHVFRFNNWLGNNHPHLPARQYSLASDRAVKHRADVGRATSYPSIPSQHFRQQVSARRPDAHSTYLWCLHCSC